MIRESIQCVDPVSRTLQRAAAVYNVPCPISYAGDEELGVFYLDVFVVEFTAVKFKINITIIIICSDHDCSEL
ncbi:hypothetical protein pdam_00022685 [Pocillopora damicornis]|uniref:Uncharacterized protein n=1 Tax=Pocillopora damicornis TaxID=46731 RepID=A0A3M6TPS2_POCDA|nr:hypothetical protein pdam_00022685 [Pocillopora damicornis]